MKLFTEIFKKYPQTQAPFLYRQCEEWADTKPFRGLRILEHSPVVENALLKFAPIILSGAELVVTNPSCVIAVPAAINQLKKDNIRYVADLSELKNETFDIHLDCGAEFLKNLKPPTLGTVELTGTGDQLYRANDHLTFPVISVDRTRTKQLETIFGMAESARHSLIKMVGEDVVQKHWLVFGFGKIGRGVAYGCKEHDTACTVVDVTDEAKQKAHELGVNYVDASDRQAMEQALKQADVIITATGVSSVASSYPKAWFDNKILANLGVLDEFGPAFTTDEVLYGKRPLNFVLDDPTPVPFLDPELYAHNAVMTDLVKGDLANGIHNMNPAFDERIINEWCDYHQVDKQRIKDWFMYF